MAEQGFFEKLSENSKIRTLATLNLHDMQKALWEFLQAQPSQAVRVEHEKQKIEIETTMLLIQVILFMRRCLTFDERHPHR